MPGTGTGLLVRKDGAASNAVYTVKVVDQNGDPVKGATVAFCTDAVCRNSSRTDSGGVTSMALEPGKYHINVIDAPDGYACPDEAGIYIGPEAGETTLTITKE